MLFIGLYLLLLFSNVKSEQMLYSFASQICLWNKYLKKGFSEMLHCRFGGLYLLSEILFVFFDKFILSEKLSFVNINL